MNKNPTVLPYIIALGAVISNLTHAQEYSEDFEAITEVGGVGTYSYGYDKDQDTAPNAYKQVNYGEWVRQAAFSVVSDVDSDGDLELVPSADTKNNSKMWATLIDPATFAANGSGVYTLTVDLIGADTGNARIWVASANGYDASGSNDLYVHGSGTSMDAYVPLSGTGATAVTEIAEYEIPDETAGGTYTLEFEYTAGDALSVAFGGYNTAFAYDNLSISYTRAIAAPGSYTESFEAITEVGGVGTYSYGYDKDQDTAPNAYKQVNYGEWVRQAPFSVTADVDSDGDLELRPSEDSKNNHKMWATLIDPATFAENGSGVYTLTVDLIGADDGAARIWVASANGYDASGSNDLYVHATSADIANYVPLSGTGTTSVTEIVDYEIDDETASGTYTLEFEYTAGDALSVAFGGYNTSFAYDNLSISYTRAIAAPGSYTESFEAITEVGGVGTYSYGYDKDQDTAPNAYKQVNYGEWVRQAPFSVTADVDSDGDLELRPSEDSKNNHKMWATLIDPATFAENGSGVYTLTVDLIGADDGAARIWVASANGYDASGSNDLYVHATSADIANYVPLSGTGTTSVTEIVDYEIDDETASGTYTLEFEYTAGDALSVAFGGYNTSFAYDNLSISYTRAIAAPGSYTESFEAITEVAGAGNYSYGYDKDGASSVYKQLDYGTWVRQSASSVVSDVDSDGDLELRPNEDTKNNGKMWATLIDPATFAANGTGVYTLSVDMIAADEGNSRIWLASANGYDASGSNDLVLAAAAASGMDAYTPLSGTGTTSITEILEYQVDELTSGTYTVEFTYIAGDALAVAFGSYNTSFAYDNLSITYTRAASSYVEDFEAITENSGAGQYSFGYDKDDAAFGYKQLDYGTWVRQSASSVVSDVDSDGDLELRPNEDTKNNAKMWATLIDPATFAATGTGVYTFTVELIGADAGNSRIWLASANGYDASGSNDLILDTAEGGMGTYSVLTGSGSTSVTEIFEYEIPDETEGGTYTVDFNYTAGDALAVSFGSYNTSYAYDNLSIVYKGPITDSDGDGLDDVVETNTGTFVDASDTGSDPNNTDSDGDGLSDGDEVNTHGTDPNNTDSDGDGYTDDAELNTHGTDPTTADTYNDGLSDDFIITNGFNPNVDFTDFLTDAVLNAVGYSSTSQPATVADARAVALGIQTSGATATLQLEVERSTDGTTWTSSDPIEVQVNMDSSKEFFRIALPQD